MKSAHVRGVGKQLLSGSTCTYTDASKSHGGTCIAADMPMRVTDYILLVDCIIIAYIPTEIYTMYSRYM